jgi:hypothetical protein
MQIVVTLKSRVVSAGSAKWLVGAIHSQYKMGANNKLQRMVDKIHNLINRKTQVC